MSQWTEFHHQRLTQEYRDLWSAPRSNSSLESLLYDVVRAYPPDLVFEVLRDAGRTERWRPHPSFFADQLRERQPAPRRPENKPRPDTVSWRDYWREVKAGLHDPGVPPRAIRYVEQVMSRLEQREENRERARERRAIRDESREGEIIELRRRKGRELWRRKT